MKTEYISEPSYKMELLSMKKGKYTVHAHKDDNGGFFLRFFNGHCSFTCHNEEFMKLPKYILSELDNFNQVCSKILSLQQ